MKNSSTEHTVPALGNWILKKLSYYENEFSCSDDFNESFLLLQKSDGSFRAFCWYWSQIIQTLFNYFKFLMYRDINMLKNNLTIALRNIRKHKVYSFLNMAGLALGIAICILIMLWIQNEMSYEKFNENADNLYFVAYNTEGLWWSGCPWALAPTLQRDFPEVKMYTRFASRSAVVKYEDNIINNTGIIVDDDYFKMFTHKFIEGSPEDALAGNNSVVLTQDMAVSLFGNEDPIGNIITVNNSTSLAVTGIIENVPSNSDLRFDYITTTKLLPDELLTGWSVESSSYVLLEDNVNLEDLRQKIAGVAMKYDKRTDSETIVDLQLLTDRHLHDLNSTGQIQYIYIFSSIALFILLLACTNYINLATARSGVRAKEICMRKIVGANKRDIIRQFYGESFLMMIFTTVIGIIIAYSLLSFFNTLSGKQLSLNLLTNPTLAFEIFGIMLFTALISGGYPAILISSFKPLSILKGSLSFGSRRSYLRKILVIGQFVITIILISATIIMLRQMNFIHSKDLGFDKNNVVIIPLTNELTAGFESFKTELLSNPQIINVTNASSIPSQVGNFNPVYWEGKTSDDYVGINFVSTDYDYFETFGMAITDGRSFSIEHPTDRENYVINEAAAGLMEMEGSVVGKMYSLWENEGKIIGVVKDFHSRSLHQEISPIVFTMGFTFAKTRIFIKTSGEYTEETLNFIAEKVNKFSPGNIFNYSFLDDFIESQYGSDERTGNILKYFTIIAILISCLGVFGLASFTAEKRTREIGIRKVLGATKPGILYLISKEFLYLIAFSNLISIPISYLVMKNLLDEFSFRTDISVWIFLFAAVLTVFIAFVTVSFQAGKAAKTNPIDSIRYE
ncbi:ABC transporter permease [candidate division KSB1 bacterium]